MPNDVQLEAYQGGKLVVRVWWDAQNTRLKVEGEAALPSPSRPRSTDSSLTARRALRLRRGSWWIASPPPATPTPAGNAAFTFQLGPGQAWASEPQSAGWFQGAVANNQKGTPVLIGPRLPDALAPLSRVVALLEDDANLVKLVGSVWASAFDDATEIALGVGESRTYLTTVRARRTAPPVRADAKEMGSVPLHNGDVWAVTIANVRHGGPPYAGAATAATGGPAATQIANLADP